jgi:hypothetical protein
MYAGSALIANWICAAGTILLTDKFTTYDNNIVRDQYDSSGGDDTHREYISGISDHTHSMSIKHALNGTVLYAALALPANQRGTLIVSPQGTVASNPRHTFPANISQVSHSIPYDNVVTISISWQGNGVPVFGTH